MAYRRSPRAVPILSPKTPAGVSFGSIASLRVSWWSAAQDGQELPFIHLLDFKNRGRQTLVGFRLEGGSSEFRLALFGAGGKMAWSVRPGREIRTPLGRSYPHAYDLRWLGVLTKPRPDGGQIVSVSTQGGSWVCVVEVWTLEGKRVAEYFHPGWFFTMRIFDFDGDGREEILLGGVNNSFGDSGEGDQGATLVVLDPLRIEGQGTVLPDDDRQVAGLPTAKERSVLLFPCFEARPTAHRFCRVLAITPQLGSIEVMIGQDYPFSYTHMTLNRELRVTSVTPDARLVERLLKEIPGVVTARRQQEFFTERLSRVRILRNVP